MKNLRQVMLLTIMVTSLVFTSCSSDDNGDETNSGDEFLTASIDGSNFAAAQSPAVIVGAQSVSGVLAVQGGDNNGNTITITLPNYTGVGTYSTGDSVTNTNSLQYLEIMPSLQTWASNFATLTSGVIEITSDDGVSVEGTFSFEGFNGSTNKMITNGEFKAIFD